MGTNSDVSLPWERRFAHAMQRIRENRQISQSELARGLNQAGLPFYQATIQRIESGERSVRLNEAFIIADRLLVTVESMVSIEPYQDQDDLAAAADKMVRIIQGQAKEIDDSCTGLFEDEITEFVLEMDARIARCMERDSVDLDKVTRWGIMWIEPLLRMAQDLNQVVGKLDWLGDKSLRYWSVQEHHDRTDLAANFTASGNVPTISWVMEKLREWYTRYYDIVVTYEEFPTEPDRLLKAFPYGAQ